MFPDVVIAEILVREYKIWSNLEENVSFARIAELALLEDFKDSFYERGGNLNIYSALSGQILQGRQNARWNLFIYNDESFKDLLIVVLYSEKITYIIVLNFLREIFVLLYYEVDKDQITWHLMEKFNGERIYIPTAEYCPLQESEAMVLSNGIVDYVLDLDLGIIYWSLICKGLEKINEKMVYLHIGSFFEAIPFIFLFDKEIKLVNSDEEMVIKRTSFDCQDFKSYLSSPLAWDLIVE